MNKRRRTRKLKKIIRIVLPVCCIIFVMAAAIGFVLSFTETGSKREGADLLQAEGESPQLRRQITEINSQYMLLVNMEEGKTVASRGDIGEKIYPASLTKIMTVLTAIEELEDYEALVTLQEDMVNRMSVSGAMVTGFWPGESVTVKDLMYAVLLTSGAEAAIGLAEYTAGSEEAFVECMNRKADEMGLAGTHFTNVVGLHDREHYSTLEDLYVMLTKALENIEFAEIFYTMEYQTSGTSYREEGIYLCSTLQEKLNAEGRVLKSGYFLGGKTGTTDQAGLCLASVASINGTNYMLITAKADYQADGPAHNVIDAVNIFNNIEN